MVQIGFVNHSDSAGLSARPQLVGARRNILNLERAVVRRPLRCGVRKLGDSNPPVSRFAVYVLPFEGARIVGIELVVQVLGVVIVDQDKVLARRQRCVGSEDQRMLVRLADSTHVEFGCVSGSVNCHFVLPSFYKSNLCKLATMVRTSLRAQVLAVLRAAIGPMSILDIADQVGRHPNTVRFHLKAMAADGQVDRAEVTDRSPGRPAQLFTLAKGMDPTGPRHYRMLAEVLVESLARDPKARAQAVRAGRDWGRRLGQNQKSQRSPGNQSRKPVTRLVQLLEEMGFAPKARRRDGAAQIGLRQCPFLELAAEHPEVVCPVHLGLMQGALEAQNSIVTVTKLESFAEPDLCVAHLMTKGAA